VILLALSGLLLAAPGSARAGLNIVTQVTGTVGNDLASLSDHVQVTLISAGMDTSRNNVLALRILGDNGVTLSTPPDFQPGPPFPVTVMPGFPQVLTGMDLQSYFDPGSLRFQGLSQADYFDHGLPPGNYRVCFQSFCPTWLCPDGRVDWTPGPPSGCSNTFTVKANEPPYLTSPPCGEKIQPGALQSVVFAWTPAPGTPPATTTYELEIVEMVDPQASPDEALETATTPPFFRQEVQGTSFFYGPGQPLLEANKSYAWRVTASNRELGLPFANGGRSKGCSFTWGKAGAPQLPVMTKKSSGGSGPRASFKASPKDMPLAPWCTVTGKLRYKFKDTGTGNARSTGGSTGGSQSGATGANRVTGSATGQAGPALNGRNGIIGGNGAWYDSGHVDATGSQPLGGIHVSLVVTYRLLDGYIGPYGGEDEHEVALDKDRLVAEGYSASALESYFPGLGQVVASTVTAGDGSFSFSYVQAPDLGLVDTDVQGYIDNSHVHAGGLSYEFHAAKVTRTLRLLVDSHYYCSPEKDLLPQPWQETHAGTLVSYVKSYDLDVTVKPNDWIKNQAAVDYIPGAKVTILRKTAPNAEIPAADEGDPSQHGTLHLKDGNFRIVAQTVADKKGVAHFTHLVRPWDGPDVYYYYAETSATKGNYAYKPRLLWNSAPATPRVHPFFNSELDPVPHFEAKTWLWPDRPRVIGRVMDQVNNDTPIADARLVLDSKYASAGADALGAPRRPQRVTASNGQGYFSFDDLDVQVDGSSLTGPDRALTAGKQGYDQWRKHLGIMGWGRQDDLTSEVKLRPNGLLRGSVVDLEKGNGVAADVRFANGISVHTQWFLGAQIFKVQGPSGKGQKMTVVPDNADYEPRTFTVDVPKTNKISQLGKFAVVRKRHRLQVQVLRGVQTRRYLMRISDLKPLAGATVEILGQKVTTDPRGTAVLTFDSPAASFSTTVTPPDDADYVAQKVVLNNTPTTGAMKYHVVLPPAVRISGSVTVGDATPVDGARVYVDAGTGPGTLPIETFTHDGGKYTLRGIPLKPNKVTVHATRSSQTTTYVGASRTIDLPHTGAVDLALTVYQGMDVTRLLGFPLEIVHLSESGAGEVTIDGAFTHLPANAAFAAADSTVKLPFHDLVLKAGAQKNARGVPVAVPVTTPVPTKMPTLDMRLFGAFAATARPGKTGGMIAVERVSDTSGRIRARVTIDPTSFSFSANTLDLQGALSLAGKDGLVTVLASAPDGAGADRYALAGKQNTVAFKLYGFSATAPQDHAYVSGDTLALRTTLHADVGKSGSQPVDVHAGWVRAHHDGLDPVGGEGKLTVDLEKWHLQGEKWQLGAGTGGIVFAKGTLDTGPVKVPVTGIHVRPAALVIDGVNLQNLSLAGVAPLQVMSKNAGFGYDSAVGEDRKGHWVLSLLPQGGTPAARLGGLPGMAKGAYFTFGSLDLISDGEQQIGFGQNASPVTFDQVFTLAPGNITVYDDRFEIAGTVDLGIPRLASSYQAILVFSQENGAVTMRLTPIPFAFTAPGKVKFSALQATNAQVLSPGNFTATGTLVDPEGIVLKTRLHRTTAKGTWVEVFPAGQIIKIGQEKTYLSKVTGRMDVEASSHDWGMFTFSGDMNGVKGMEGDTRKTFTIHGDITADNQSASVQNIPTPFGNLSITFDYPHARMTGSLQFDKDFSGVHIKGLANMVVDRDGWYFLTGGNLTLPGFGNLQAGMLIGDYDTMPKDVIDNLMQYAYNKNVPPSFQHSISGFFFTGRKNIPQFTIPDEGFNLGIVSAHFGGETGLDGRVWMSFDGPGTTLGIGAMGFIDAHLVMSSITCTSIVGAAAAEMGAQGVLNTNGQFDLSGCGSLAVIGSVQQCIPTPSLKGISCKMCVGVSVQEALKITMTMGTSGVDAGVGLGTCSGTMPGLTSGW